MFAPPDKTQTEARAAPSAASTVAIAATAVFWIRRAARISVSDMPVRINSGMSKVRSVMSHAGPAICNRRPPICNKDFEICSAIPDLLGIAEQISKSLLQIGGRRLQIANLKHSSWCDSSGQELSDWSTKIVEDALRVEDETHRE